MLLKYVLQLFIGIKTSLHYFFSDVVNKFNIFLLFFFLRYEFGLFGTFSVAIKIVTLRDA